ncbi:MAG: methylaspartate mutase subunit E [Methylibium sp.]|uniref:methylaspartate mutase subunit E n=1 Tax=Methylibium sp. TaxID=2067992 RepID=UPI001854795E|nr:methylaspartate mutase subunit E [Methylibium sp.]MBA3596150.1 methylaspartate mutase subunit E [Methylibium sp.]
MSTTQASERLQRPISEAAIDADTFASMRRDNLARWPTGKRVDLDEAVTYLSRLPLHKNLAAVTRAAHAERRCLTQPRGGFGTIAMQRELMVALDKDGMADIVPTTTDSYTRNEMFELAQKGMEESEREGRSLLNGFPIVNYGHEAARLLVESIDKPAIMLTGTTMPKLTGEIGYAAGYTGYLGSGIAYTVSYIKDLSVADGIRNYQYLDRLVAEYQTRGVELHRRQPGFLTGTNVPPCIAISICVLDCLLAAAQGVRHYGLELGQTLHVIQDAAAIACCEELAQEYLGKKGYTGVFTPVSSLHWMGAWPYDEAQAAAMVALGGYIAAVGGAVNVTTKSVQEAHGIPTPQANAEGLRTTRMGIYLARGMRLDGMPEYEREKDLIRAEVRAIVDRTLEMGDGDAALGSVRAFEAGVLDVPWSPNRHVKSRIMPARDADGYLRVLDAAAVPLPRDVMEVHEAGLRRRAEQTGCAFDHELAVQSVYEHSEPLAQLMPEDWFRGLAGRA